MDYWNACRILGVEDGDNSTYVKKRYRILMQQYHPDSFGDDPDLVLRAQLINEAYTVVKKQMAECGKQRNGAREGVEELIWDFPQNEYAFCDRDLYLSRAFYEDYRLDGYKAARGKYYWDAEREDFKHLLLSLNQLCSDQLEEIERKYCIYNMEEHGLSSQKADYKAKIFHLLVQQFIDPIDSLHKTYRISSADDRGRSIFLFPASVAIRGSKEAFEAVTRLMAGDYLYAVSLKDNRIRISDGEGVDLGHISFEDDRLYYMVIPALAGKAATVKLLVKDIRIRTDTRPCQARLDLDFYLRLEQEEENPGQRKALEEKRNRTIRKLLMEYESYVRGGVTGTVNKL